MKNINEKFTDIADKVSEQIGTWYVTVTSVILVFIWLALGPAFHFSNTWQLLVNTPTTIFELWIGFLLAAAANRSERNNKKLMEQQQQLLEKIANLQNESLQEEITIEKEIKVELQ